MLNRNAKDLRPMMQDLVVREIPAFLASANPEVLPTLAQHSEAHIVEIERLLAGGKLKDFEFVKAHGRLRAEQHFPIEATLHAYRVGHKILSHWMREAALATASVSADKAIPALADFAIEYTDAVSTVFAAEYVTHARLLAETLGRSPRLVVRLNDNACRERWFSTARARVFGPTIAKRDTRQLLRALRSGDVVAYSADQNFSYQHAFVAFFGIPAATLVSTPKLVRSADAIMLPFWFHRKPDGRYHLRVEGPWPGWSDGDPANSAAIYMRELEAQVRKHPEQYLWMHRRFKTRPPGASAFY